MDIREWLQDTVDREPPDEQDQALLPEFLQSARNLAGKRSRSHHRKKKRPTNDAPSPVRHIPNKQYGGQHHAAPHTRSSDHIRNADTASSCRMHSPHRRSDASDRKQRSPDRRFNRTFARRARHKTKEDRYELKQKKRKKDRETRDDTEAKSKRRRLRRPGDGSRTNALVQSFQLKDKPRDKRLTLQPADANLGIFKHGKAGAPVPATVRGPGLPDLVFNEMRFLQRSREIQNETKVNEYAKQNSKLDGLQNEGDISAYFTKPQDSAQMLNAALEPLPLPSTKAHTTSHAARDVERPQAPTKDNRETMASSREACLGFASRGPATEGRQVDKTNYSYYTWSESISARHSPVPRRPLASQRSSTAAQPQRSERLRRHYAQEDRWSRMQPKADERGMLEQDARHEDPTKRASGLVAVDSNKSPVKDTQMHEKHVSSSLARRSSLSLPRGQQNSVHSGPSERRRWRSGSVFTSDILKIREHYDNAGQPRVKRRQRMYPQLSVRKENEDPSTSTPTSKLLRKAFRAIEDQHEHGERETVKAYSQIRDHVHNKAVDLTYGGHAEPTKEAKQQTWNMPKRGFSRSTETSGMQQRKLTPHRSMPSRGRASGGLDFAHEPLQANLHSHKTLQNELLHDLPFEDLTHRRNGYAYDDGRRAENLVRHMASHEALRLFHNHFTDLDYVSGAPEPGVRLFDHEQEPVASFEEGIVAAHSELRSLSHEFLDAPPTIVDGIPLSESQRSVGGVANGSQMPGFWRPNMLY